MTEKTDQTETGADLAAEIVAQVETGPRIPEFWLSRLAITLLCLGWSGFQLYVAYQPMNATLARSWHLAFAILLVFLAYPDRKSVV